MFRFLDRIDRVLWSLITVYIGVIYATLSVVSRLRVWLAERFGPSVWDYVYGIFALIGVGLLVHTLRRHRGWRLVRALRALMLVAVVYAYYLSSMHYAVERIHFLQYGLLGALIYKALGRHWTQWASAALATTLVYLIGLGDEAIQWALPHRVGEIGDGVINLFSGILGILTTHVTLHHTRESRSTAPAQVHTLLGSAALTTVATALFLTVIHGFGHVIEVKDPGRLYSAFTAAELARINRGDQPLGAPARRVYENEATRHLHQREFYFTNDFAIAGGGYYRSYDRCHLENRILQKYYGRFLDEYAHRKAGIPLASIDPEIAARAMERTVCWPDSLGEWVRKQAGSGNAILESRVKSTIITEYGPEDLWFHTALILIAVGCAWRRYAVHTSRHRARARGTGT